MYYIKYHTVRRLIFCAFLLMSTLIVSKKSPLPLFYWKHPKFINFGDHLSLKLVERIVGMPVAEARKDSSEKKLLAIGSIISFAGQNDVVWGSGIKRNDFNNISYKFTKLDVRAVRGPISREFLIKYLNVDCPEVYGDPALLIPFFFPEFKRSKNPKFTYIIIPHYSEIKQFPKDKYPNVVYPTEPWDVVIQKILDSEFVISSSLHGIIVAEAFGIPAQLFRVVKKQEPLFKYQDYYWGTNRFEFKIAFSIEEALRMGGEKPIQCDLKKLYEAFPFDYWPNASGIVPGF